MEVNQLKAEAYDKLRQAEALQVQIQQLQKEIQEISARIAGLEQKKD